MPDEPGDLLSTDFDRIVRRCKQFDAHYVRNGMLPRSCFSSYDGYMRAAEGFNEYGGAFLNTVLNCIFIHIIMSSSVLAINSAWNF